MSHEAETIINLRQTLDQEYIEEISIVPVLESHHKYLKECISTLTNHDAPVEEKQKTLKLFFQILNMHAKAEEEVFYNTLKHVSSEEVRLEGLRGEDEHEIAYEIIDELKEMKFESTWSEDIDAKVRVLSGLIKGHIKEEETIMFKLAERAIPESTLLRLTEDYLDKCKLYLDVDTEDFPSDVSRSDVMTFFY